MIGRIAKRQVDLLSGDASDLIQSALTAAVAAAKGGREHLVTSAVLRAARERVMVALPKRNDIKAGSTSVKVEVDVAALRTAQEARFDKLIAAADWDGLITRYPLRESPAFDRVVDGLKLKDQAAYRAALLKLLQDEPDAVAELRHLLGDLYATVIAQRQRAFNHQTLRVNSVPDGHETAPT